jgi:hypothetical protein
VCCWNYLPGTLREVDQVIALAGDRPVCLRRGAAAGTGPVLADLPRARWAHLATHGFFADPSLRSALQLDERLFAGPDRRVRAAPAARNPLVLSGLVLSGANRPLPADAPDRARHDGGILTAEAIAGLPLQGLELAVLSACETGLGEVAGGEGVFGLQRAFHLAGTHAVVASLWKVDDRATRALMAEFYRQLAGRVKPEEKTEKRAPAGHKRPAIGVSWCAGDRQALVQAGLMPPPDPSRGAPDGKAAARAAPRCAPAGWPAGRARAGAPAPAMWSKATLSVLT